MGHLIQAEGVKNLPFFAHQRQKLKNFAIFGRLKLNLCVINAIAEDANENHREFYREIACDIITYKLQETFAPHASAC